MKYLKQIQAVIMGYLLFHANKVSDKKQFPKFYQFKNMLIKKFGVYTGEWQCQWMPAKECYHCNGTGIDVQYRENVQDFDDCICDRCYGDGLYTRGTTHILDIYLVFKWRFHQPRPNSKETDLENKFTLESLPKLNDSLPPIVGYVKKKESGRKELLCMSILYWLCEPKIIQPIIDSINKTMAQMRNESKAALSKKGAKIYNVVFDDDNELPF